MKNRNKLAAFLDEKVALYNRPGFIDSDPIRIPHYFTKKQDIEIAAFFAAIFAWGNRTTIINKSRELLNRMDHSPHQFILHHQPGDLKRLLSFRHRTFNDTDLLYFIAFLHQHYSSSSSLETAFSRWLVPEDLTIEKALIGFYHYFFSLEDIPLRTRKHIASPEKNSSCKRLCMFLRWMVRKDRCGVDFGLWKQLKPRQLICPMDVHVVRVATGFGLLGRAKPDWQAAKELTAWLRELDPEDPVKYDFALFGLGAVEHY